MTIQVKEFEYMSSINITGKEYSSSRETISGVTSNHNISLCFLWVILRLVKDVPRLDSLKASGSNEKR